MTFDGQHLQDDVRARADALDATRSFIVQAPAGSGKTELLIQRYLKLLSFVDEPEEILAITFTKKASAEMQLRVLDALQRADRGSQPAEDHQKRTFELASKALCRSRERDWNLIGNPRRMRIMTLDALNAAIAKAQPFSAPDCANGARIVMDAELDAVHRNAALATLDWLIEQDAMAAATKNVLRHVDNNTTLYVSYLAQMLRTRDQWLPFIGSGLLSDEESGELRSRFEDSLKFTVEAHLVRTSAACGEPFLAELPALMDFAGSNLAASAVNSNPILNLAGTSCLPAADIASMDAWLGLAELLLTQKGEFRKQVDKRQGFPAGNKAQKQAIADVLENLHTHAEELAELLHGIRSLPPLRYSDEQWDVLLALFRLLPLAVTELRRLFAAQGTADYIEVALNAGAALGTAESPGDIALLLDYQLKHLLIDEMQDTSSAQYRMLEALTGGWEADDGRTLFCVGDPMQSVYRFRNAEVGQFLLARQFGVGHVALEPLLLRRNFRSGERLVDWFNTVFPAVLSRDNDPLRGAVTYSKAVHAPQLAGQGDCYVHPVFGTDSAHEARMGCEVVKQTLAANPDDDMAVLVRSRTHLPQLLAELRAAGVAYRAVEIDRLTDLPEIIDVLSLTRAAAHQGDRVAWLGLLRAPWIGLSWADLNLLAGNDTQRTVWELLEDADRRDSLSPAGRDAIRGCYETLRCLVLPRRSQSLRDLIERCWLALGGPGTLDDAYAVDNIYRYLDVLSEMEYNGTLSDVAELESSLDQVKVSSNEIARLQVMTMHRAKGLQFDHVLLYALGRQAGKGDNQVLSWFDVPGQHGFERKVISPVGPRAVVDRDPVHRYIDLTEKEKNNHEQGRLLYVACTRARKTLHLMGNTNVKTDGESFSDARRDSLLYRLWPAVLTEFEKAFEKSATPPTPDPDDTLVDPVLKRFTAPWQLPAVSALPGTAKPSTPADDDTEVQFYWVGTDAPIAGTLVHRWLQRIVETGVQGSRDELRSLQAITRRWLLEMGIGEKAAVPVLKRVEEAVRNILDDPKGIWILEGEGHAELPLSGVHRGELVSVVLDRVRIDDDGSHWIIDYKTSSHEGGNIEGFLQAETERYRTQLERYASIYRAWSGADVKCALYFPILQSFVEVPV